MTGEGNKMGTQCDRLPQCDRQQQEYEFVMEGISTRMTLALEKMADSNRMMSETNKRMCAVFRVMCVMMILVVLIVALGLIIDHQLCNRNHTNTTASEVVAYAGAESAQTVSEPGP
jgi:hypothetical protein